MEGWVFVYFGLEIHQWSPTTFKKVEGHYNPGLFNPKLQPQTSTPNFSTNELFNPGFFYHEYWAEKSGVEAWGWNFQTLKIGGRFNPDFSMNYSILGLFNHTRLKKFWYWNLALKSLGLKCPQSPMDRIFNPRWLKSLGLNQECRKVKKNWDAISNV